MAFMHQISWFDQNFSFDRFLSGLWAVWKQVKSYDSMKEFQSIDMFENLRFEEIFQSYQNEEGLLAKTKLWQLYILKYKVFKILNVFVLTGFMIYI